MGARLGRWMFVGVLAVVSAGVYAESVPRPDALLMVDQHREAIVERIVKAWPEALTAEQANVLRGTLAGLRADRLLAISISPGLGSLLGVLRGVDRIEADKGSLAAIKALGDAAADLVYTPVTPCRLFDTRVSQGGLGTPTVGVRRTYGAITPVASQGGVGGCAAVSGAAVALIQIGTLTPSGHGLLQGGPQGAASFPNALILYQPGDQYGTAVAMPLNLANGEFDLLEQYATADLYGDLLGYFKPPGDATSLDIKVAGQRVMRYEYNAISPNLIGGHPTNSAVGPGFGGTIAGGGKSGTSCIEPSTRTATRSCANHVGTFSAVGGGEANVASYPGTTVSGGVSNTASSSYSTVSGGEYNTASHGYGVVGGGQENTANGFASTVCGGQLNKADESYGFVGGGANNVASNYASTVGGGRINVASGLHSTVPGGMSNTSAGDYALAAGYRAKASALGSFVWGDSSDFDFASSSSNEFAVRATGGVRFVTAIDGTGLPTWTCGVSGGAGGSWGCSSDRNLKIAITPLDGVATLERLAALPVYQWVAKDDPRRTPHAGPTAQDFMAAFGLGDNDKMIGFADAQGVAFAAIQGLNAKLVEKDGAIDSLKAAVAELKRAVEVLLDRISSEGRVAAGR